MNYVITKENFYPLSVKWHSDGTYKDYDLSSFNIKFDNFKLSKDEKYLFLMDCYENKYFL